jgi:hypothetical protein
MRDVHAGRLPRDEQGDGDLRVRPALDHEPPQFDFARREQTQSISARSVRQQRHDPACGENTNAVEQWARSERSATRGRAPTAPRRRSGSRPPLRVDPDVKEARCASPYLAVAVRWRNLPPPVRRERGSLAAFAAAASR